MYFSTAFTILELIILSLSSSFEATTPGFAAPIIPLTSPKHPLYNPNATYEDIITRKLRISVNRQRYFQHPQRSFPNVIPIEAETIIAYSIGSPPVESIGIFDTGSDFIWMQCQPCVKCYKQEKPIFDPAKSSTYKKVSCNDPLCQEIQNSCASETCIYNISYNDGSSSAGDVAMDTLTFPETVYSPKFTLPNTLFGCGTNNHDIFSDGYSGIVGLGNISISLIGQMKVDSFAYCKNEDGGYIRLGPISRLMGLKTTLSTDTNGHYHVNLLGLSVDDKKVDVSSDVFKHVGDDSNTGVIIDSGTPITSLTSVAMDALKRKFIETVAYQAYNTRNWEHCYNGDDNQGLTIEKLPSVHLIFDQNTDIALPKENVWTQKDEQGNICLKIRRRNAKLTILGADNLADFNVGYDLRDKALWLDYQPGCEF